MHTVGLGEAVGYISLSSPFLPPSPSLFLLPNPLLPPTLTHHRPNPTHSQSPSPARPISSTNPALRVPLSPPAVLPIAPGQRRSA